MTGLFLIETYTSLRIRVFMKGYIRQNSCQEDRQNSVISFDNTSFFWLLRVGKSMIAVINRDPLIFMAPGTNLS